MTNLVKIINNEVVTNSVIVAEMFGKEHRSVIRDIETKLNRDFNQHTSVRVEISNEMISKTKNALLKMYHETTYKDKKGENRKMYVMNRDGMLNLVMSYKGDLAEIIRVQFINAFNDMEKQLKSKQDSYLIADPIERAKAWIVEQEQVRALTTTVKVQEQQINELKPKASYYDTILQNKSLMTITQIAKDYGMTARKMNELLHSYKIQYKQSNQWLLYTQYQTYGYTSSQTMTYTKKDGTDGLAITTKWTQKGRLFLYDFLKNKNVLPLIEQD